MQPATTQTAPKWKRRADYAFRSIVPLAFSIALIVWLFHRIDFKSMIEVLRSGVDFRWIVAMMGVTTLSHIIRGYRWGMQLSAAGVNCREADLAAAVFGNYALNLVIPRIGEVWRSIFIARRKGAKMSVVFGTVLGDRLTDGLTVLALICFTLLVTSHPIDVFIHRYHLGEDALRVISDPLTWCVAATIVTTIYLVLKVWGNRKFVKDIDASVANMWKGVKVLATMPHKLKFLALTIGIWVCYFSQIYLSFYAFPFTRRLVDEPGTAFGLIPALVAFVFSTLSMAIPSNGGLGPWNLAIIFGLSMFGIGATQGAAFSVLVWGAQSLMLVILGIYTAIYIMATRKKAAIKP